MHFCIGRDTEIMVYKSVFDYTVVIAFPILTRKIAFDGVHSTFYNQKGKESQDGISVHLEHTLVVIDQLLVVQYMYFLVPNLS